MMYGYLKEIQLIIFSMLKLISIVSANMVWIQLCCKDRDKVITICQWMMKIEIIIAEKIGYLILFHQMSNLRNIVFVFVFLLK